MIDVDKAIATTVKTGKVVFGTSEAIKSLKAGKAQLVVVASNSPHSIRGDVEYYAKLSQIPVVAYKGNSFDLGLICGKPFAVVALTIKEPGDSEILKLAEKPEAEPEAAEDVEES